MLTALNALALAAALAVGGGSWPELYIFKDEPTPEDTEDSRTLGSDGDRLLPLLQQRAER
ncbi:MAG: hypothetical protein HY724_11795 [Candidatus Rokubacteria bacterium]|nr:hypothetical protein [Candidatus Rokubacteria bacterium]